jgi:hypothetical protein
MTGARFIAGVGVVLICDSSVVFAQTQTAQNRPDVVSVAEDNRGFQIGPQSEVLPPVRTFATTAFDVVGQTHGPMNTFEEPASQVPVTTELEEQLAATLKVTGVAGMSPRSKGLMLLYGTYVALSAVDGTLTWFNVRSGASEINPVLRSASKNAGPFFLLKAGTTASTLYLTDRLSRTHPTRARVIMAAINGAMGWIVWRNSQIAVRLR